MIRGAPLNGASLANTATEKIVKDEVVVATLPVPAGGELLGLEAGEAGLVGVLSIALAGEEGGGVGAGLLGAAAKAVAGGIGLATAVVGGDGAHDAEPDAEGMAGRGVV